MEKKKLLNIVIGHWNKYLKECPYETGILYPYSKKKRNEIITRLLNEGYCIKVLQNEHNDTLMIWINDGDFRIT